MRYLQCDKKLKGLRCNETIPLDAMRLPGWGHESCKDLCPQHLKEYTTFKDELYKNAHLILEGWFNE